MAGEGRPAPFLRDVPVFIALWLAGAPDTHPGSTPRSHRTGEDCGCSVGHRRDRQEIPC